MEIRYRTVRKECGSNKDPDKYDYSPFPTKVVIILILIVLLFFIIRRIL